MAASLQLIRDFVRFSGRHDLIDNAEVKQIVTGSPDVASQSHSGNMRVPAPRHSQGMTRFAIGDVSNGTCIENVDVSAVDSIRQLMATANKLVSQGFDFSLIQLAAQ